jgi:negative regulator of sigma E activity
MQTLLISLVGFLRACFRSRAPLQAEILALRQQLVEPLGLELHLVNPYKTRAIASARIKHDQLDSRTLAVLLRLEGVAEAYIAPR